MIESVIFRYLDGEWVEKLSVGNQAYMKQELQDGAQLIEVVGLVQTQEQRYRMTDMCKEELYRALTGFMKKNELKVLRPN